MQVGLHLGYQNLHGKPDVETFMQETRFAIEAEAMGFDFVGPVEHHFTDYAACPDPFQMLAYVAAKTKKIKLITAAVILPWNNPLRVVESALQLDILSEGRLILGMGRGAARREFRSFGVELKDSREMFDETALIVMNGVETGIVEADTQVVQDSAHRSPATALQVLQRPHRHGVDVAVVRGGRGALWPADAEVFARRLAEGDSRNQHLPGNVPAAPRPESAAVHHLGLRPVLR